MTPVSRTPMETALRMQLWTVAIVLLGVTILVAVVLGFGVQLRVAPGSGSLELSPGAHGAHTDNPATPEPSPKTRGSTD